MNNLGHLPAEVIISIAEHLDEENDLYVCTLINKRFHSILNPILWRAPHITDTHSFVQVLAGIIDSRLFLGQHIRRLHFGYHLFSMNDALLMLLMLHVPRLEELHIQGAESLTDMSITRLAHHCPRLQSLHLETNHLITSQSLISLAQLCPDLRTLGLDFAPQLPSPTLLTTLATALPLLDELVIKAGPSSPTTITMEDMALVLARLNRLTSLTITPTPPFLAQHLFTSSFGWPRLTTLHLTGCEFITDQQFITFIQFHPHLTQLHLTSTKITNAALDIIPTRLPSITSLSLDYSSNITHHGLRPIISKCLDLQFIQLFRCGIMEVDFPEVNDVDCIQIGSPSHLRHLNQLAINNIRNSSTCKSTW